MDNNSVLFVLFFSLLIGFYYIFYANPYNILSIAKIPIILLCVFTLFFVYIFIEYYISKADTFGSDTLKEMLRNFMKYSYKYLYFLFYIFSIAFLSYFIFKAIQDGIVFTFHYSFFISVGLLILILALVDASSGSERKINADGSTDVVELIKAVIMYIPCLITDAIQYIKKDYENTPSTVFIVFLLILVYIIFFYLVPLYKKQQYKNDGILLIEKAAYLNTDILSITNDELIQKIQDKRPFYDKWFQKIILQDERVKRDTVKMVNHVRDSSMNFLVPPDGITLPYYLRKLEGFTSLQNEDKFLIPYHIFAKRANKGEYEDTYTDASGLTYKQKYAPEAYKKRMNQYIVDHPQILTALEKAQYMYSTIFASWDTIKSIPTLLMPNANKIPKYDYHYAISSWVYLQEVQSNAVQTIFSYGSRPSLYYDPATSVLFVAIHYRREREKILYKTSAILFQRWNFIVMNYKYGTLDLFINNNLVGTYPDVLDRLDHDDMLLVGSSDNKNIGGICNMKYYELPLGIRKINNIYNTFHNKKIPV